MQRHRSPACLLQRSQNRSTGKMRPLVTRGRGRAPLPDRTICLISVGRPSWSDWDLMEDHVDLATFRMVVLADELLEGFFGHDLAASFQLDKTDEEDYHQAHQKSEGLLGGFMNLVVTNESVCAFLGDRKLSPGIEQT